MEMQNVLTSLPPETTPWWRILCYALVAAATAFILSSSSCDDDKSNVDHLGDPTPKHHFSLPGGLA